jgi:hypothetical protein
MDIIFFMLAGLVALWVLVTMIEFMGLKEVIIGVAFIATLVVVVCGVLRGAADKTGLEDRELPGVCGAMERVFR